MTDDMNNDMTDGMTNTVKDQIIAIRDSGKANMLDLNLVQRIAFDRKYFELVLFIEEHRDAYVKFIFYGDGKSK